MQQEVIINANYAYREQTYFVVSLNLEIMKYFICIHRMVEINGHLHILVEVSHPPLQLARVQISSGSAKPRIQSIIRIILVPTPIYTFEYGELSPPVATCDGNGYIHLAFEQIQTGGPGGAMALAYTHTIRYSKFSENTLPTSWEDVYSWEYKYTQLYSPSITLVDYNPSCSI